MDLNRLRREIQRRQEAAAAIVPGPVCFFYLRHSLLRGR